MSTLRIMMDAAHAPEHFPAHCQAFMIYAGGDAEHVWTEEEIAAAARHYDEALPVWVYAQGRDGRKDGIAFREWLNAHGIGANPMVLLDMETGVDHPYVEAFDGQIDNPIALYGSTSTLFGNPDVGGWFPADPTGSPHLFAHQDVVGTQYAWFGLKQTLGPWDLSLIDPAVHLWTVHKRFRVQRASGDESLLEIASGHRTRASAVLRITARQSPPAGFEPALATYLDRGDLSAPVPAGVTLWLPQ